MVAMLLVVMSVYFVIGSCSGAAHAGNFFSPCSLKDPQIESCILTQAKALLPHLAPGVREWGLTPLDPIFVPKLSLADNGNQAVNVALKGTNVKFVGFKDAEIESVKADVNKLHFEFTMTVPEFVGEGQYEIKGMVLVLPITGHGNLTFHYYKEHLVCSFDFKRVEQGGKKIMKLEKVDYKILEISKITQHFGNLFGNKQLSDNTNKILSDHSQNLFKELKSRIEDTFSALIYSIFEPMFNTVAITDLFTDVD